MRRTRCGIAVVVVALAVALAGCGPPAGGGGRSIGDPPDAPGRGERAEEPTVFPTVMEMTLVEGAGPTEEDECPAMGGCASVPPPGPPAPDVVGMRVMAACEALSRSGYGGGAVLGVVGPDAGGGGIGPRRVVSQDPGPGRKGPRGVKVELTVSAPYPAEELRREGRGRDPDCVDLTEYGPGGKPDR